MKVGNRVKISKGIFKGLEGIVIDKEKTYGDIKYMIKFDHPYIQNMLFSDLYLTKIN